MVISQPQVAESLSDSFESRPLGLLPERVIGIGAVDDLAQQRQRRIFHQIVLAQNRLKGAFLAVVPQFNTLDIEWRRAFALGHRHYLVGGDKQELRLGINKFPDEPGASHPVNLHLLTGNPLHCWTPSLLTLLTIIDA